MPEPTYIGQCTPAAREMLLDFLDAARGDVASTVAKLDEADLERSLLPTGWTPLQLLVHLAFMERRWIVWGFLGEAVNSPHGDRGDDVLGSFVTPQGWGVDEAIAVLEAQGRRTRDAVDGQDLDTPAALGGRFTTEGEAPSLGWILLHVLGEYTRHQGQLDVAVELLEAAHERYDEVPDADYDEGRTGRADT